MATKGFKPWTEHLDPTSIDALMQTLDGRGAASSKTARELELNTLFEVGRRLVNDMQKCSGQEGQAAKSRLSLFLSVARRPSLLTRIVKAQRQNEWFALLLDAIVESNFTTGKLFLQRIREYGNKTVFQTLSGSDVADTSWSQLRQRVFAVAKGLLAHAREFAEAGGVYRAAILSENTLDMVAFDLACLSCGFVNVPLPVNATPQTIRFILNHSQANVVFISKDGRLAEFMGIRGQLKHLKLNIALDTHKPLDGHDLISHDDFLRKGENLPDSDVVEAIESVGIDDLATIMYTSGTTEMPKGIKFSQRNIVSKRFARALALPEIGDQDRFLCYLPLFHTFGRYFEMLGSIFWGATYIFIENTKIETIIDAMRVTRPTVFISIPRKWIQLYEKINERVDVENDETETAASVVRDMTGGRLKWGLSAAGYLDPDIFRFFQECGTEIMSGFGMTEATGGITMTPPFRYQENSVGAALPGIEITLAKDGEMLIRGPYVTIGYLDDEDDGLEDGWLRTGDIFKRDNQGFFEIIDRKKEIYKNVQGETISPQKIENLFSDFEAINRVFLVGDHREFNTLLIHPNYDFEQINLSKMNQEKLKEFFGSFVVSVNQFLASYERIVNYALIARDFDAERGELTAKNTYKRKEIEKNFASVIDEMYSKDFAPLTIDGFEIRIPAWFLREKGLTADDLKVQRGKLELARTQSQLRIKRLSGSTCCRIQIGDFIYQTSHRFLDLSVIIRDSSLLLGNLELAEFVGRETLRRARPRRASDDVSLMPSAAPDAPRVEIPQQLKRLLASNELTVHGIHLAARVLQSEQEKPGLDAIDYLEAAILERTEKTLEFARLVLLRTVGCSSASIKRSAFRVLVTTEKRDLLTPVFNRFLLTAHNTLNAELIDRLSRHDLSTDQLRSVVNYVSACLRKIKMDDENQSKYPIRELLNWVTAYGVNHPAAYKTIRAELVRWRLNVDDGSLEKQTDACLRALLNGFREWLGANPGIAIDPETSREFRWKDVVAFDESVPAVDRETITEAIGSQPVLREAIFVLSGGRQIPLQEIPPRGVAISFLGALHGKAVYRAAVQTHHYGPFDVAININRSLIEEQVLSEIHWLICAGGSEADHALVEEFGGYWPEYGLWTEEFVSGETVARFLRRLQHQEPHRGNNRILHLWPSFVWSGLSAYVDFWNRSGRRLLIADPTPDNVIVPSHDFQVGFRIVSISSRKPFDNLFDMMLAFRHDFVESSEREHPSLAGKCSWHVIFSAFIEILGEAEGIMLFEDALNAEPATEQGELCEKLRKFIRSVRTLGYKSERLHFAIQRFDRWHTLNPAATPEARMQTMRDIYTTYILAKVDKKYPGARIQFYRDTAFARSKPEIIDGLNRVLGKIKTNQIGKYELPEQFAQLRADTEFSDEEEYFLTRLSYPHLGAHANAQFIALTKDGSERTDLVVFVDDSDGRRLAIRKPANPKEVAKLHRLFTNAKLPVEFHPEHQFLVVLNPRGHVVGGMFYRQMADTHVHIEKIVMQERHRRKEISDGLLNELFNRLRSSGVEIVTVGYLRPKFFYKFGFKIDHRYGNMVKRLDEEAPLLAPAELDELLD